MFCVDSDNGVLRLQDVGTTAARLLPPYGTGFRWVQYLFLTRSIEFVWGISFGGFSSSKATAFGLQWDQGWIARGNGFVQTLYLGKY